MHLKNVKQKLLIATLAGVMVSAGVAGKNDTAQAAEADAVVTESGEKGAPAASESDEEDSEAASEDGAKGTDSPEEGSQEGSDVASDDGAAETDAASESDEEGTDAASESDEEDTDAAAGGEADVTGNLVEAPALPEITSEDVSSQTEDGITENTSDTTEKDTAESQGMQKNPEELTAVSAENGWVKDGNYYYYYIDGEAVKNTVMEIDGYGYGFDYYGRRRENTSFSFAGKYYRAKSGGFLYRSEWYTSSGSRYYYGSDFAGCHGIVTVSGTEYLFRDGKVAVGEPVIVDGVSYAGDQNGAPVKLKKNGWTEVGKRWFYCIDGKYLYDTIREINGEYYGFSYTGYMYDDTQFYSSFNGKSGYCRAGKGGKLYRSEWVKIVDDWETEYYYYTKDFVAPNGYTKIGTKYYVFDSYGEMLTSRVYTKDGIHYLADKDGYASIIKKVNGWVDIGDGNYSYLIDGDIVTNSVIKDKDGKYYGFDSYGRMYKNSQFNLYEDGISVFYYAGEDGSLYVKKWREVNEPFYYNYETKWFYYGEGGKAARGLKTIGGKTYYFDNYGEMQKSTSYTEDGVVWLFDSNGVGKKVEGTGWIQIDGKYYYSEDGVLVKGQKKKIGSRYYIFNSNGILYTNCRFSVESVYYRAAKSGALLEEQWYEDEYYGVGGAGVRDFTVINDKKYYFNQDGHVIGNNYIFDGTTLYRASAKGILSKVTKDGLYFGFGGKTVMLLNGEVVKGKWMTVDGSSYYFDYDGIGQVMKGALVDGARYVTLADGSLARNGWMKTSSGTYYAKPNGELLTGTQEIDGKWYSFDSYGKMRTGLVYTDGNYYRYGNDGARVGKALTEGWNKIQGEWYYVKNGSLFYYGTITIDEEEYYFYDSRMMTNYIVNDSIYDKNGHLVKGGWYKIGDNWYYVDPDTREIVRSKLKEIAGKEYYFDYEGVMQAGTKTMYSSNTILTIDANGVVVKKENAKKGYFLHPMGLYLYFNSDNTDGPDWYIGWVGDYYIQGNVMMTGMVVDDNYYVGTDGKRVKKQGWQSSFPSAYLFDSEYGEAAEEVRREGLSPDDVISWYYVKANGKAAVNEWLKIGGSWYYFDETGMMTRGATMLDGNLCLFEDNGKWIRTVKDPSDGWYEYQDTWVYVESGRIRSDENIRRYGLLYGLNNRSLMMKNTVGIYDSSTLVYYGKTGAADFSKTGWQKINGKWYYFLKNGRIPRGWVHLGKQNYYIDMKQGMLTGTQVIDGQLYTFNSNGALVSQVIKYNGWYEGTDGWYYFESGNLIESGEVIIGGKTYYFRDCKMVANRFYKDRYLNKSGLALKNTWKKIDGKTYYFGADGKYYVGFHKIDGKEYLFDLFGRLIK